MTDHRKGAGRFPTARSLQVEDLLEIYDGIIDAADEVLEASRITGPLDAPSAPDGLEGYVQWADHSDPLPPDDMTEVSPLGLGKLFSYFQNWTNYVASEVTRAKCIKDVQERHLKVIKSALSLYYKEEVGVPANVVEDKVFCDSRYVEVDAGLLRVRVFWETAKSREEQLRRTLNNISREQTRRASELAALEHDEHGGYTKTPTAPTGASRRRRTFKR